MIPDDLSPIGTCAAIGAARGLHVFPIRPNGKTPLIPNAHRPEEKSQCRGECGRLGHGLYDASADVATVASWWRRWPAANIGLATGASGLYVVDTDSPEANDAWLLLVETHRNTSGALDTDTCTIVQTANGWHYWFAVSVDSDLGNTAGNRGGVAPGIDTRGQGGYVLYPPSRHPSGAVYRFETPMPTRPMPTWLAHLVRKPEPERRSAPITDTRPATGTRLSKYAYKALEAELTAVLNAATGTRNDRLNVAAFNLGQLIGAGLLPEQEVRDALFDAGTAAGLTDVETIKTIESGITKGMANPRRVTA